MSGRRWTYDVPSDRSDHRGHELLTVAHRKDWRGRWTLAARLCLTCHRITREWRICGEQRRSGRPCMRPAQMARRTPWPCLEHDTARRACLQLRQVS